MRLYSDLASWFHLVSLPGDYAGEAAFVVALAEAVCPGSPHTLLELGAGAGNNASHLKHRFACTLTDLSPHMLAQSQALNPECEHIQGDMRDLRLGRRFDVVFIHDAIDYMTSQADLAAAIATAAIHVEPDGAVIVAADDVREGFGPETTCGGHDGPDGRAARYLQWVHDAAPGESTYGVDYVFMLKDADGSVRLERDHHVLGLFPTSTWRAAFADAGLELVELGARAPHDPYADEHVVFVARPAPVGPGDEI